MGRHRYRHYGFTLDANRSLPRLTPASDEEPSDITVELLEPEQRYVGELEWVPSDPSHSVWRAQTAEGTRLRLGYADKGEWAEFHVDERGTTVWVGRSAGVGLLQTAELLQGPVFSCVLAQRGVTCLHGAVVHLDGRTLALVGLPGAGKSTTAMALLQRGALLVSDDVAPLTVLDDRPAVRSGAARLRMRPDPGRLLLEAYDSLESVWGPERPEHAKRYFPVAPDRSAAERQVWPLDVLYFLAWSEGGEPSVGALTPARALSGLMAHRHMVGALDGRAHRRDFEALARLAQAVPAREVRRPYGLAVVEPTVAEISSDVGTLSPAC